MAVPTLPSILNPWTMLHRFFSRFFLPCCEVDTVALPRCLPMSTPVVYIRLLPIRKFWPLPLCWPSLVLPWLSEHPFMLLPLFRSPLSCLAGWTHCFLLNWMVLRLLLNLVITWSCQAVVIHLWTIMEFRLSLNRLLRVVCPVFFRSLSCYKSEMFLCFRLERGLHYCWCFTVFWPSYLWKVLFLRFWNICPNSCHFLFSSDEWEDVVDGDAPQALPLVWNLNTISITISAPSSSSSSSDITPTYCSVTWSDPLLATSTSQFTLNNQCVVQAIEPDEWADVELDYHSNTLFITGQIQQGSNYTFSTTLSLTNPPQFFIEKLQHAMKQELVKQYSQTPEARSALELSVDQLPTAIVTGRMPILRTNSLYRSLQQQHSDEIASQLVCHLCVCSFGFFTAFLFHLQGAKEIAFYLSPNISVLIQQAMLNSINLYEDVFARLLGLSSTLSCFGAFPKFFFSLFDRLYP